MEKFKRFIKGVVFEFTSTFRTFWVFDVIVMLLIGVFAIIPAYEDGDYLTVQYFWISSGVISGVIFIVCVVKSILNINEEDDIKRAEEKYKNKK